MPIATSRKTVRFLAARLRTTKAIRRIAPSSALAVTMLAGPAYAAGGHLQLIPDPFQLTILVIVFAILIFPINAILFAPLFRALDARDEQIAGNRRKADTLAAQAQESIGRYESAVLGERENAEHDRRRELDAARAEQAQITAAARGEAEREIDHARDELQRSLDEARGVLRDESRQLARQAAERILGRTLS